MVSLRIFGSRARGTATDQSDIDLLSETGPDRSFFFPGGFVADLESLTGAMVDIVTEAALPDDVRDDVLAEALPL